MKGGQLASPSHAVGHACLSCLPLNGKEETADSAALGNKALLGYGGLSRICPYVSQKCFQVPLNTQIHIKGQISDKVLTK